MGAALSCKELVQRCVVEVERAEDLRLEQVQPYLDEFHFAVVRGLAAPDEVRAAKERMRAAFSAENDRAATGEHPQELHDNFQKLSIGGAEQSGVYRPRCMRTFYNPIWAENIYGLREIFIRMARVRNVIYGFPLDFAIEAVEDEFWTASRVHHYPSGGGFLVSHLDNVVPRVQAAEGINLYYQPILIMSRKGSGSDCDFEEGGGFFELDGTRYFFESECELGDFVIYDGNTRHGVADVDIGKPFRQDRLEGRLCAFCTLYRNFTRKGELGDYIEQTLPSDA